MPSVTEESLALIVKLLSDRMDNIDESIRSYSETTMAKLDEYVKSSNTRIRELEAAVMTHAKDIAELRESKEKKWADRHPILMKAVEFLIAATGMCLAAKFLPGVAHLLGSI